MKRFFTRQRSKSLKYRVLTPAVLTATAVLIGLVGLSHLVNGVRNETSQSHEANAQLRSVKHAANAIHNTEDLREFVAQMGAREGMHSIFVIDESRSRILASSIPELNGKVISAAQATLPAEIFVQLVQLPFGEVAKDRSGKYITASDTTLSIDPDTETPYRVVLSMQTRSYAKDTLLIAALLSVTIGSLLTAILVILDRRILTPIRSLEGSFHRDDHGDTYFEKPHLHPDEIGRLAKEFDITFRKVAQQSAHARKLNHDLSFQRTAVDLHAIVSETDARGRITHVNEAMCRTSQYSWDELVGQNHRILNSGLHPKEFWAQLYRDVAEKGYWNGEVRNKCKDGSFYWVDATIVAFRSEEGKIERFVAIRTDITSNKEAELKLLRAQKETERSLENAQQATLAAERSAQAKSQFLATMSHEIRTPMNGLLGVLHLIEQDLPSEKSDLLQTARRSGNDLLVLINDILDFSKIDAGEMQLETIEVDAFKLIEETAELHANNAHAKAIDIGVDCPTTPTIISGDPTRLRQILSNLVGNAIKFTETGHVKIAFTAVGRLARFEVSDTGIGIEASKADHIFENFTQANSTTTRKFGGTGLGLAICRKLVDLMDGKIWVESEQGIGSRFIFEIPIPADAEMREPDAREWELLGKQALIADVDSLSQETIREWIKRWGIEASLYRSDSGPPPDTVFDIVILDEQNKDDLYFYWEKLKQQLHIAEDAKIILTRRTTEVAASSSIHDPHGVLTKPIQRHSLLARLTDEETWEIEARQEFATAAAEDAQLKILVVDDNPTNRLIATQLLLKRHQIEADTAVDGQAAIDALRDNDYDLVIMDCMMPGMDGYEATRALRNGAAGESNKTIPIIALTANVMDGDKEKCLAAGMDDYMGKPIEPAQLATLLTKWESQCRDKRTLLGKTPAVASPPNFTETVAPATLDISKLERVYGDDTAAIAEMLKIFQSSMVDTMDQLKTALAEEQDNESTCFFAHRMHGSAAEFGAATLSKLTKEMEALFKKQRRDDAAKLFPKAQCEAQLVDAAIDIYCRQELA